MEVGLLEQPAQIVWLIVGVALYGAFCLYWALSGARRSGTVADFYLGGRDLPVWTVALAVTATSFAGGTFLDHPAAIYQSGFQAAYLAFFAIVIPFTGVLFMKRQWVLGRRFEFLTPGEMYSAYFGGDVIRLLAVIVALGFAIPYLALQLLASGTLVNAVTDGAISVDHAVWFFAGLIFVYVVLGGLRAVANIGALQFFLFAIGIVLLGTITLVQAGGFKNLNRGIAEIARADIAPAAKARQQLKARFAGTDKNFRAVLARAEDEVIRLRRRITGDATYRRLQRALSAAKQASRDTQAQRIEARIAILERPFKRLEVQIRTARTVTPEGYSRYVAIPGISKPGEDGAERAGGAWSGLMILTFMFALMGIQASPAFTMWAFSSRTAGAFAPQQVWLSALVVGLILIVFSVFQGFGAHLIGFDPQLIDSDVARPSPAVGALLEDAGIASLSDARGGATQLVPMLISLAGTIAPWLVGLLAICALAAMQSTGAAYLSTTSSILTRDFFRPMLPFKLSRFGELFLARLLIGLLILAAVYLIRGDAGSIVSVGSLVVALGFQLWPALLAICYVPWLTGVGVTTGLLFGMITVVLTEKVGGDLAGALGFSLPWGRWPLSMHSAFWGIAVNLLTAILVSAISQSRQAYDHRMRFHQALRDHASMSPARRGLVPFAWIIALVWFFFAIGPGAVIGNTLFGHPSEGTQAWVFGIPSIWAWQILWWLIGVFMLWLLAYGLQMSTDARRGLEGPVSGEPLAWPGRHGEDADKPSLARETAPPKPNLEF